MSWMRWNYQFMQRNNIDRLRPYHIYLKYWDTLTPYHTCPKIWKRKSILLPVDVSKIVIDEWQTVQALFRRRVLRRLNRAYTFCSGRSIPIFKVISVYVVSKFFRFQPNKCTNIQLSNCGLEEHVLWTNRNSRRSKYMYNLNIYQNF